MLKDKKIVIATHVYTTGPAQDLKEYLLNNRINKLLFIGHPLFYNKKLRGSGFELYENGALKSEKYQEIKKIPELLSYLKDFILSIFYVLKTREKWDLYVGSDNLNALSGVMLKLLGKVNKTVFYVIDYNPKRFQNKILNSIYHKIDQLCVTYCDVTWNLSPRMETARKEYFNYSGGNQKVVPIGVWLDRIKIPEFEEVEKNTLVFMGHILEKQGVQYVLEAIPEVVKEIKDFKFKVIGGGEYLPFLKEKSKDLDIERYIEFTDFVADPKIVEQMLVRCAAGIALYTKTDFNGNISFTYFTDPGKIKLYLACGLPVLLTDVPHNTDELVAKKVGILVDYSKENISRNIIYLMGNKEMLRKYKENSIDFARNFDWGVIFEQALREVDFGTNLV